MTWCKNLPTTLANRLWWLTHGSCPLSNLIYHVVCQLFCSLVKRRFACFCDLMQLLRIYSSAYNIHHRTSVNFFSSRSAISCSRPMAAARCITFICFHPPFPIWPDARPRHISSSPSAAADPPRYPSPRPTARGCFCALRQPERPAHPPRIPQRCA